jgi:CheY-like chemotaxis protein
LIILDTARPGWDSAQWVQRRREESSADATPLYLLANNPGGLHGLDPTALRARYLPDFLGYEELLAWLLTPESARASSFSDNERAVGTEPEEAPFRVLVAEDHPHNQKVIEYLLRKSGCQVDLVANGLQAVEKCRNESFDLIILDLQMPEMDGLTALREIKTLENIKQSPPTFMALTANAFAEDRQICLDVGFDLYEAKPITAPKIRSILHEIKRSRRA